MTEFLDRTGDRAYTRAYKQTTPDILSAFNAFDEAVFASEGREIPLKYRELIALAVGITTQCLYCIDSHSNAAVKAGATETELTEAAWVATAIRAGGGFAHGRLGFKFTEDARAEHTH
jgi:AhpD family alkylhydroperoxidase